MRVLLQGAAKVLALVAVTVVLAVPTALTTFTHSERHLTVGAHDATVEPTFDGHATFDFGAVLPSVRLPLDRPFDLGVHVTLGASDVEGLDGLIARDAAIASQPEGEIDQLQAAVVDMARASALRGLGVGLLGALVVAVGWRAVGRDRRRTLRRGILHPRGRHAAMAVGTAAVLVLASRLIAVAEQDDAVVDAPSWLPLREVFPEVPADAVLDRVEITDSTGTQGSRALVAGALKIYRESVTFYGDLEKAARDVVVRTPEEGETTALVVTDRHDNVGMDPVARAIADVADARLLIDLGDDTSGGGSWERFSINSLAREFRGFDIVAVAGNHDVGPAIEKQMRQRDFIVLKGEPRDVAGIRFLGQSDPRSTSLLGYRHDESDNVAEIAAQDARLREVACEDGNVDVVLVHSSASAKQTAASGCVDAVLSGHLHFQKGPTSAVGENGRATTSMTTGTTGGAVLAFALGSELRRDAQVTIVTFAGGTIAGLQPVTFRPGGQIEVGAFTAVVPSPR